LQGCNATNVAFTSGTPARQLSTIPQTSRWCSRLGAVYLHELVDGFEAERVIGSWMTFYSDVRPHSALGGRTPAEAYGEERAA